MQLGDLKSAPKKPSSGHERELEAPGHGRSEALRNQLKGMSYEEGVQLLSPDAAPAEVKKKGVRPSALAPGALNEALSIKVLQDAFGSIKPIECATKLEVLSAADFEAKYEEDGEPGDYQLAGPIEGFEIDGQVYINAELAAVDTIAHEILHANVAADWTPVVGEPFDEGSTEYLTIASMKKAGKTPTHSYPEEEACVRYLISQGLPENDLVTAYLKGGAQKLIAAFVNSRCCGSWTEAKAMMEAEDWAHARAKMTKK